jgi:hypothetical protein
MVRILCGSRLLVLTMLTSLVLAALVVDAAEREEPGNEAVWEVARAHEAEMSRETAGEFCAPETNALDSPDLDGSRKPTLRVNQCACMPTCYDRVTGCVAPCNISTNCQCAFWMCP